MAASGDRQLLRSEWYEYAEGDLTGAKIIFNAGGSTNTIGLLLQQAVEKYLKGYLLGKGWNLIRTHNIEFLLEHAIQFNPDLESYLKFGQTVTALYAEDRYPSRGSQDVSHERLGELIVEGERLIEV